jgi:transcriptional regulator of aromatic amino acid metabolism
MGGKVPSYHTIKLTYEDAQMIRELYSPKEYSSRKLAKIYGISHSCILSIIKNKYYTQP